MVARVVFLPVLGPNFFVYEPIFKIWSSKLVIIVINKPFIPPKNLKESHLELYNFCILGGGGP